MRREMWKRLQRSVIEYRPSWCRATKRARSVMGVVSFQGMKYLHALRSRVLPMYPVQSVTYVTGSYTLCLSPGGALSSFELKGIKQPLPPPPALFCLHRPWERVAGRQSIAIRKDWEAIWRSEVPPAPVTPVTAARGRGAPR